jgi:hypothetical protein
MCGVKKGYVWGRYHLGILPETLQGVLILILKVFGDPDRKYKSGIRS